MQGTVEGAVCGGLGLVGGRGNIQDKEKGRESSFKILLLTNFSC